LKSATPHPKANARFSGTDFQLEAVVSVLVHTPTDYKFTFDLRNESVFWAHFSPGHESPEEHKGCKSWPEMLSSRRWKW
jgi:hypothetical protein